MYISEQLKIQHSCLGKRLYEPNAKLLIGNDEHDV